MTTRTPARQQTFGAQVIDGATRFTLWAPAAADVRLVVESGERTGDHPMRREPDGTFHAEVPGVRAGDLYRFRMDGAAPLPDPASRFQPLGVHGPSQVIDPDAYHWTDDGWSGLDRERTVFYELHVGTFTREGTFTAAAARLPYLRDLAITVIELMPVADFAGHRNWGYDGVCLFAPARAYGEPDDLRRFVDEAHRLGLAVVLDVVYNHFGPDGAYMSTFAPSFFSSRHCNAWGDGVNVDGPGSPLVRRFITENAACWISDYHMDGLRLDATHALPDDNEVHIVAEIAEAARRAAGRSVMVVAEDHRNLNVMLHEPAQRGWGLDGVWADDFHHIVRRILAGDSEGYYEDFRASMEDLATTLRQGWFFTGQHSRHLSERRGTDPAGIPPRKFVVCLQNHDQIGNRAFGDRLHHGIPLSAYRAASALLLLAPQTPLLFMGQEWAASTPFRYFTDHNAELGEQIVQGRRREFERFSEFRNPALRERIPSPQDPGTFEACRLRWEETDSEPHRGTRELYRRLLELRAMALRIGPDAREHADIRLLDDDTLALTYASGSAHLRLVARLRGSGAVDLPDLPRDARLLLTTEDAEYAIDGHAPKLSGSRIEFSTPAAVVLEFTR
jgi:maltooligosyltrehalose trehalohydrolase